MNGGVVAAVDLGATSGRVVLGRVGPGRLEIEDVHRFPNVPVRTRDGLHWNIFELYRNILEGLRKALTAEPGLVSIGIDSWAVDYALLRGSRVVSVPFHYRDERTARGVSAVAEEIGRRSCTRPTACSSCPSTRSTSWPSTGTRACWPRGPACC